MFGVTALAFAGGEENIIQPNASLFLVFVLFLIFVFVLNRSLFRPIGRVLDEREALTEGATNEARGRYSPLSSRARRLRSLYKTGARRELRRLEQRDAPLRSKSASQLIERPSRRQLKKFSAPNQRSPDQAEAARASLEAESRQIAQRISRTVLGRTVGGGGD